VRNPVGWMLANRLLSFDIRRFATEHRTALEEAQKMLRERLRTCP
jgi:hypothetical protein